MQLHARPTRGLRGSSSGTLVTGTRTYASSIDASIANLQAEYVYDPNVRGQPIIVPVHGYNEDISAITLAHRYRYAGFRAFVLVPGMRGRNGASGTRDAGGREAIGDLYDAIADIREEFEELVDPDRLIFDAYSGGAGDALAALAKMPDLATYTIARFGPSDYGWRTDTGWYYTNNASFGASLTTDVGASPSAQPGWWRSRNHADALAYQLAMAPRGRGPLLSLYHDADDPSVSVAQSDRVRDVLEAAGLSELLDYRRSTSADAIRYLHGYPHQSPGVLASEADWTVRALNAKPWRVPEAGEVLVAGAIRTKRFSVWLSPMTGGTNAKTNPDGGRTHVAHVRYAIDSDGQGGVFRLLPLTGECRIRIEVGESFQETSSADPITVTV